MRKGMSAFVMAVAVGAGIVCGGMATFASADEALEIKRMEGEKPGMTIEGVVTMTGVIEKIDKKTREVSLRMSDGELVEFVAGEQVKNFKKIKKGDEVSFEVNIAAELFVRAPGEGMKDTSETMMVSAEQGEKPGMVQVTNKQKVGIIKDIDPKKRTLTIVGPLGNTQTLTCGPEVQRFDKIQKNDEIVLNYSQMMAVSVDKPSKKK